MTAVTLCRQQRSLFLCACLHGFLSFQLRAALYDIHDIFFEMPLMDRLMLLQQERELRAERKLRELVNWKKKKNTGLRKKIYSCLLWLLK